MEKKEVYLVSALDSLGVPYTMDNQDSKSFIDLLADTYIEKGYDVSYVNLCSLGRNKTWELIDILEKDYSKGEYYKKNKRYAQIVIDRKTRFKHPVNPGFLDRYYDNVPDPEIKITTKLKESENPIFIYTCGGMNFDYYSKMPSCDIREILPQMLFHLKENLNKTMSDIKNCVKYISDLNENIVVYVLGVYPMIENKWLRKLSEPLYTYYNKQVKIMCDKFENVYYVDIFDTKNYIAPQDEHPTFEGQQYMTKQIIKTIGRNI